MNETETDRQNLADAVKNTPKLPRHVDRINRLRYIVQEHSACRMEGLFVDVTTANMLVKIYDALNEQNRAKFVAMPLRRMVAVGWKLVK